VYVYSVGDVTGSDNGPFASVTWKKNVRYMLIYHIFSGLWINAFFGAMIQFILATACALWYFNKPNEVIIVCSSYRLIILFCCY